MLRTISMGLDLSKGGGGGRSATLLSYDILFFGWGVGKLGYGHMLRHPTHERLIPSTCRRHQLIVWLPVKLVSHRDGSLWHIDGFGDDEMGTRLGWHDFLPDDLSLVVSSSFY
ncbi:unnamed protein product [Absidia cylindrospora]